MREYEVRRAKKASTHLILSVYFRREVFSPELMGVLETLLRRVAPRWSAGWAVAKDERSKRRVSVSQAGALHAAVLEAAPPKFGVGDAVVCGAYDGILLILASARSTGAPEANRLTIEITDLAEVEGKSAHEWIELVTRELATHLPCRYARGHSAEEFDSKNLVAEGGAVKAIGTNLRKQLPGLYWLNFFGEEWVVRLGREPFDATYAGVNIEPIDDGVLLRLSEDPSAWTTEEYRILSTRILADLGRDHFFVKAVATV